ncbi:MAG: ACP phosphodiesterase [Mizugakiibacter sp.]|uniref:acyl carrier protein phosphodiesterase n=1 Tax=Mizugakiibacter sp. TaxID=1972610 RepID=UPI0031C593CE|nr:ACP phosphodiesterase [Xanthomonadaceae bacterium]
MNHLAHALLAGDDPALVFGSLLGDFVRGAPDPALPPALRAGIRLHRAVDAWTDAHPIVVAGRARFAPPWRRYAGILLDVWFDHCLAGDFARWADRPLDAYAQWLHAVLDAHAALQPPALRRFVAYMRAHALPAAYRERATLDDVFAGLSHRLSRANPLAESGPALDAQAGRLAADFEAFFPQLSAFAAEERVRLRALEGAD